MDVLRDPIGGYGRGLPSRRTRYGFDKSSLPLPPVFAAHAAAMLERKGFDCSILDGQILDLDLPEFMREVEERKPDVVVARISLQSFEEDLRIMSRIKDLIPTVATVGWGIVCKVEPLKVLASSKLDLVVRDELEFTLPEVIEKIDGKQSMDKTLGITFRIGEKITSNPGRPFAKNLDVLPIAAYHLLEMERYVVKETSLFPGLSKKGDVRYACIYSSRGCSYNCVYCGNPVAFGPWRAMSPERTIEEIDFLVENYGVQAIRFMDSCFNMNVERIEALCDEIINRNLNIFWACEVRAEKLTERLVKKMKKAGCIRVEIGVETGDAELLKNVGKPGCTLGEIKKAFRVAREEGISTCAFLMVGLPGESWKTIQNTKRLLSEIKPDDVIVSIATPFPGTLLHKMAEENGWLFTSDWKKYTAIDPVMELPGFTREDMRKASMYLNDLGLTRQGIREIARSIRELKFVTAAKQFITGLRHAYNMVECKFKGRD